MSSQVRRLTAATICLVALGACDESATGPRSAASTDAVLAVAQPAARCVNVAADAFGPLGIWSANGFGGFGLVPSPITLGDDAGMVGSFVSSETISGAKGQGAHHIVLSHVFWSSDGESWFRTEDRASCAPADHDPATCTVNDHLTIVDGAGDYANAGGHLKNHGFIVFTSIDPPAGTLDLRIRGRICGDGVN